MTIYFINCLRFSRTTAVAMVFIVTVLSKHAAAAPESVNPVDRVQVTLASSASRLGGRPQGIIALLELWRNWDRSTPAKTLGLLEGLAKDRRLSPARRMYARALVAEAKTRLGDLQAISRGFDELGYVRQWRVIGPFDNEGKQGLDKESAPEAQRLKPTELETLYPGRERQVRWRFFPDIVRGGYIPLDAVFQPNENVCALAESSVYADKARMLTLWLGAGGAVKVYWNGAQVFVDPAYRRPARERSVVAVPARQGLNRLLIKVCNASGRWGFYLRVGDERGDLTEGLRYDASALSEAAPSEKTPTPSTVVLQAPLGGLEKAARGKGQEAEALENLARYLLYTDSDDPSERRAKQLAADAVERGPTVSRYFLAASLAEERGDLVGFSERAYALSPTDPKAIFLRASAIVGGPSPEDALPLLDKIPAGSEHYFEARTLRATILRAMELAQSAYRELEGVQASAAGSAAAFRALAEAAATARRDDDVLTLRRQLLAIRYDDLDIRRAVVDDAIARGQAGEALEHAEILRQLAPGSASILRYLGSVYDALRRDDLALATYRKATELSPENAAAWVAYGQALLRAQYRPGAIEAFGKALGYRPQDAETRELLEQLQKVKPAQRFDEAYAIPESEVRAARVSGSGYSATVLQDLTVKTVFDNGLGSSFHQLAVQVHDKEGTRQWQSYSIQYDPDSQRVDLRLARIYRADGQVLESVQTVEEQLGEPWYRIYYDTRALVVVFPNLEPGDTVELRYRVDDIAHRNLFADYFGDLHPLQRAIPVTRARYVLVTPASRAFYFHQPKWPGLQHTQKTTGQRRIDDFTVQHMPAMTIEPATPGMSEISPYLHVSTYRSWSDVGKWYWGLIKDQLYADEALKRVVQQLTKDAPDARTKLRRIHRWVVRNTRYVALEFGIHGFLPYRAPLVVQRGFGDCKDKASLLYTMLREAGIDARIVLARTRHNGAIDEQPASLAVFDHAITYLPEFDLYVDPTAEHNATTELPLEDQGIMVLLVGPQGSELRRTPVLDPDRSRRTRTLQVRLAPDGSAHVEGAEVVAGSGAPRYREYYQAPGTRRERLERDLATDYPGVELLAESFETLDDLDQPVRFTFRARVPQFGRWDGDELRLAHCSIHDLIQALAPAAQRRYPLDLRGTSSYVEERTVQIPAGMRATDVPTGGEVRSEFGRLRIRFRASGRQLVSQTDFEMTRDRISPEQYPAFRRWVEAADLLLRQRVTIRRGEP